MGEIAELNALITSCAEQAMARAASAVSGPLAGVPLLVKDLFDTAAVRTTYGSKIYADHVPERTATAVGLLENAGAIVIGKANLHEFAWGTTSQNPHWGFVQNPFRPGKVAGGSSGGNAAALAAFVSAIGLGSDTAGSVRIPSACCGTVGFKPAHGRVSLEGCLPLSPTFDVAGPMARSVVDCALTYSVLAGRPLPAPRIAGLVIGVLEGGDRVSRHEPQGEAGMSTDFDLKTEIGILESLGARVLPARIPEPKQDLIPILLHEAAVAHRETFPARATDYGDDTRVKWEAARSVPAIDVYDARLELPAWRERARAQAEVDLYLTPTLATPVPSIDVWEPDVRVLMVANTRVFSLLGWAAISIGGIQLAGPDEQTLLAAALALEAAHPALATASVTGNEAPDGS